jgi:hypothetical protein
MKLLCTKSELSQRWTFRLSSSVWPLLRFQKDCDNEEFYLVGCNAVQSGRILITFRMRVLPPCSGGKVSQRSRVSDHSQKIAVLFIATTLITPNATGYDKFFHHKLYNGLPMIRKAIVTGFFIYTYWITVCSLKFIKVLFKFQFVPHSEHPVSALQRQAVIAGGGNNFCLLWESCETHKCTVWIESIVFLNVKSGTVL